MSRIDTLPALAGFSLASTEDQSSVCRLLESAYDLHPSPEMIEIASGTASSRLFRAMTEKGPVVVKASSWFDPTHDIDRVRDTLCLVYKLSERLRAAGARLPRVFVGVDGATIQMWNQAPTVVMEYVHGMPFDWSETSLREAGKALGEFHRIGTRVLTEDPTLRERIAKEILVEMPYEESREIYSQSFRQQLGASHDCSAPEVCQAVASQIPLLDTAIAFVDASGVNVPERASGILHNDVNAGNLLFNSDGTVCALVDVDQMGIGPFVWDLGNTLASFATKWMQQNPHADIESRARSFLQSYHHEHPLAAREYLLLLAATQRWDLLRILRSLRRHRFGGDRLPELLSKIPARLLPRLAAAPRIFAFLTEEWIRVHLN